MNVNNRCCTLLVTAMFCPSACQLALAPTPNNPHPTSILFDTTSLAYIVGQSRGNLVDLSLSLRVYVSLAPTLVLAEALLYLP